MGDTKYTCCDHAMEQICSFRDVSFGVTEVINWCHQCGRLVKVSTAHGGMSVSKTYTPVDAYKGIGRECL